MDLLLTGTPVVNLTGMAPGHFEVELQPTGPVGTGGLRIASVRVASNDVDEPEYAFNVHGRGVAVHTLDVDLDNGQEALQVDLALDFAQGTVVDVVHRGWLRRPRQPPQPVRTPQPAPK